MSEYKYQAVDRTGRTQQGKIAADSLEQATQKIKQELGLIPLEITQYTAKPRGGSRFGGSRKNFVLNFTQQLANLLNAGVQVDDALTILVQLTGDQHYRERIQQIQEDIQGGSDLSQALSKYPNLFDSSYISMIRAGESGGVLGLCAQRLTDYLEQDKEFRSSIKGALTYPFIVMIMGIIAVIVLFIFVVPRFVNLFASLGQSLPLPTRILLGISDFLLHYWYILAIVIAGAVAGYVYYKQTDEGRLRVDALKLKIPFLGQITTKMSVSRFCRILSTMLESGVPLLKGLEIAKSTLNNAVFVKIMDNLHDAVRKGGTLSGYLKTEENFPELAVFLIGVGERTGELDTMLQKVADTFAKEVQKSLDTFLTVFEPAVIVALGGFVVFVVISILLPIFSLQQLPF